MIGMGYIGTCMDSMPRQNLGPRWAESNGEELFAESFARTYDRKFSWLHSGSTRLERTMAREIPVNGFGIADLVAVSWALPPNGWSEDETRAEFQPTVRAFEFKLNDWRKGLMQAHRYRFFADVSVLVLPVTKLDVAKPYLETFRKLNVGLWGFKENTGSITMVLTPRPRMPVDRDHRDKAIRRVIGTVRKDPPVL